MASHTAWWIQDAEEHDAALRERVSQQLAIARSIDALWFVIALILLYLFLR
jgi:hypothetical protein